MNTNPRNSTGKSFFKMVFWVTTVGIHLLFSACAIKDPLEPKGPGPTIIRVNPNGTADFSTIQAAIDSASDGEIVELAAATYWGIGNQELSLSGKEITIHSENDDPATCIINCATDQTSRRGFTITSDLGPNTIISGLSIINASTRTYGGAIYISNSSPTFKNCEIKNCSSDLGAGLYISGDSSPVFVNCVFSNNMTPFLDGGAFAAEVNDGSTVKFQDCIFIGNNASGYGGAGFGQNIFFNQCYFAENQAGDGDGGAFHGSNSRFEFCVFLNNKSNRGGALSVSTSTIFNCSIVGNEANYGIPDGPPMKEWGGGILSGIGNVMIQSIVAHNWPSGISCDLYDTIVVECSNIFDNVYVDDCADNSGGNNISSDPLFCDLSTGNLFLQSNSPCLPEPNPGCGLIGALGADCGADFPW